MKKRLLFSLLTMLLSIIVLQAQQTRMINVSTPGTLSDLLGTDKNTVTDLTLTGTINAADFATIKGMTAIKNLNMSAVDIDNGTIPPNAFEKKIMESIILPISLTSIGASAFEGVTIPQIDFSGCPELTTIGYDVFRGSKIGNKTLDFSNNLKLKNFENIGTRGTFTYHNGHVILPQNLTDIPTLTLAGFTGTVDIPQGLVSIGAKAFWNAKLTEINLPSSLTTIMASVFEGVTIPQIDFSGCSELTTMGPDVFRDSKIGNKTLDFSNNFKLKNFGTTSLRGTFTYHDGHVILPQNLTNIPTLTFAAFYGTVDLPSSLITIEKEVFWNATLTEINLPVSILSIGSNAFKGCTQLEKIISNNPTPPALGTTVFNGVNKEICKLVVPESSIILYSEANQWKDFLNIDAIKIKVPETVKLHYTETYNTTKTIIGEYKGVRVGEYYWMDRPFRKEVCENPSDYNRETYIPTWRNNYQITKQQVDTIQYRMKMFQWANRELGNKASDPLRYNPQEDYLNKIEGNSTAEKIATLEQYYGTFHSRQHIDWMWSYGRQHGANARVELLEENENNEKLAAGWDLPNNEAMMQLIAMCGNGTTAEVRQYLSYGFDSPNAPQITKITSENSGFNWFNPTQGLFNRYKTNGYDPENTNRYQFNLFPAGARYNGSDVDITIVYEEGNNKIKITEKAMIGDFNGLNQQATIPMGESYFELHDMPHIKYNKTSMWCPIRYSRALTNEELGYKLYVRRDAYSIHGTASLNTEEMILKSISKTKRLHPELTEQDIVDTYFSDFDIIRLSLDETPPTGYVALPRGYVRGFYVQYFIDYPTSSREIVEPKDILKVASRNLYVWRARLINNEDRNMDNYAIDLTTTTPRMVRAKAVADINTNIVESADTMQVEVYDLTGRLVVRSLEKDETISSLKTGTYIVKEITSTGVNTYKIMKK